MSQQPMVVFEVHLAPGADPSTILSKEMLKETGAVIMTLADAANVGFNGLPEAPPGQEVRIIACRESDRKWVRGTLEKADAVGGYRVHQID